MIRWLPLELPELWQETECRRRRAAESRKKNTLSFLHVSFSPPASAESITFVNICQKPMPTTLGRWIGFLRCSLDFRGLNGVPFTLLNNSFFSSLLSGPCFYLCTHRLSPISVYLTFHLLFLSQRPGGELFEGSALRAAAQLDTTVSLLLYPDWFSHKLHKRLLSFESAHQSI